MCGRLYRHNLEEASRSMSWRLFAVRSSWAISGILLIGGCAVDQKKEVAAYRKIIDQGVQKPIELAPGQELSLENALALANEHNEQLALRGEDYLQALINKNRA